MLFHKKLVKYHEENEGIITAISDCKITIGVEKIRLKEGKDGYNHSDLAKGAIQNFLSYDEPHSLELKAGETFSIQSFVAYAIIGEYIIDVPEVIFSVS